MESTIPADSGGVIVRRRPRLSRGPVAISYRYEADASYTVIIEYTDDATPEELAAAVREVQR